MRSMHARDAHALCMRAAHASDAFHLSALRYVPAAAVMLVILARVEGLAALRPGAPLVRLWILGSLGFAGFSILGFLGIAGSTPEHAAIIVALMPLVAALVLWLLRGTRPSATTLAVTLVALAGVVLVVTRGHLALGGAASWHADARVLAGVVCWVLYTTGASTLPQLSVLRYRALSMALGALTIVVVTFAAVAAGFVPGLSWTHVGAVGDEIAYLSLVSSVAAVLAWNAGIAKLGPSSGVLFINLVPITAFVVGVAQGHRFGAAEIVGGTLTVVAVAINGLALRHADRARAAALAAPVRASAHRASHRPEPVPHACG